MNIEQNNIILFLLYKHLVVVSVLKPNKRIVVARKSLVVGICECFSKQIFKLLKVLKDVSQKRL